MKPFWKVVFGGCLGSIIAFILVNLILFSMQKNLRPIVNPELKRTICLAIRKDYIHESLLNVVVRAVKSIIPGALLAPEIRKEYLRL